MISIDGLQAFSDMLAKLDADTAPRAALEQAASRIAEAVRAALSHPPGGDHTTPWLRTGALRDSIGHDAQDDRAAIGSTDQVAVDQELGTAHIPPRPFLAPIAAARAPAAAAAVGAAAAAALAHALGGGE